MGANLTTTRIVFHTGANLTTTWIVFVLVANLTSQILTMIKSEQSLRKSPLNMVLQR